MQSILILIDTVLELYFWCIIISAILSWLVAFNVVNTSNRFVYTIGDFLYRITEPALRPFRRWIPNLGGIDVSPIVVILLIFFIRNLMREYAGPSKSPSISPDDLCARGGGGVRISIRLTPNGSKSALGPPERDAANRAYLKAQVTAAPENGKANAAPDHASVEILETPKSSIAITAGAKDRLKTVEITGDPDIVLAKLQASLKS